MPSIAPKIRSGPIAPGDNIWPLNSNEWNNSMRQADVAQLLACEWEWGSRRPVSKYQFAHGSHTKTYLSPESDNYLTINTDAINVHPEMLHHYDVVTSAHLSKGPHHVPTFAVPNNSYVPAPTQSQQYAWAGYRAPVAPVSFSPVKPTSPLYRSTRSPMPAIRTAAVTGINHHALTDALAVWYAEEIVTLLVKPEITRAGVGGSSDMEWGLDGRDTDSWCRMNSVFADVWDRLGMKETPVVQSKTIEPRRNPATEPLDPYNIMWAHSSTVNATLVNFIKELILRMTIPPTSVVAAVWYLKGVGLHPGDGSKNIALRALLEEASITGFFAVEKRIALIGLLIAGKWLDDNSFLSKSWQEVSSIPLDHINKMELYVLEGFFYSLYIPSASWAEHVGKAYSALVDRDPFSRLEVSLLIPLFNAMIVDAHHSIGEDSPRPSFERRLSNMELPAAGEQATSRDWRTFSQPYAHVNDCAVEDDDELGDQNYSHLVSINRLVDDDDEIFVEYDGAQPWLPPAVTYPGR